MGLQIAFGTSYDRRQFIIGLGFVCEVLFLTYCSQYNLGSIVKRFTKKMCLMVTFL